MKLQLQYNSELYSHFFQSIKWAEQSLRKDKQFIKGEVSVQRKQKTKNEFVYYILHT